MSEPNEKFQLKALPPDSDLVLRAKAMDLDSGYLGRIFGSQKNAPMNIAGVVIFVLVGSGICTLFFQSLISALEYWKIIVPLLTLIMGYLFGKGAKEP